MAPRKLKKAGTMQTTAQEGQGFLKRAWSQRTYNFVSASISIANTEEKVASEPNAQKPKLAKNSTMISTAKEAESLLKDTNIDSDAKTRNQAIAIESLTKKPKLAKNRTMMATAEEGEMVLKGSSIDADAKTRNRAKEIQKLVKPKLKKNSTMTATAKEAIDILSREPLKESRSEKASEKSFKSKPKAKRPVKKARGPKKPSLKKTGTMVRTAKEGKAFVKRINKKSK